MLALLALLCLPGQAPEPALAPTEPVPPPAEPRARFHTFVEATVDLFPTGTSSRSWDVFGVVTPALGLEAGDDFAVELGAPLRLRLYDAPPDDRQADFGGWLRREDWDETSDFGQLVRRLRLGHDGGAFALEAGALRGVTLGHGHLVSRYANVDNPDYHPCGATVQSTVGPLRSTLLASDVMGARLFAGDVSADLGRLAGASPAALDRLHLSLSGAFDLGRAGGPTPPASFMYLDFDGGLYRTSTVQVFAFTGLGSRFELGGDLGLNLGLSLDAYVSTTLSAGLLVEARRYEGGFRHGFFGPAYELGRFSGLGLSGEPLASERLPAGASGYVEARLAFGPPLDPTSSRVVASAAVEYFQHGRIDLDASVQSQQLDGQLSTQARFVAVGLGQVPRYFLVAEARWRLAPAFFLAAHGGTVFLRQPDGHLLRGVVAGLGGGIDFER